MKKPIFLILLLCAFCGNAFAQKGMAIKRFFEKPFIVRKDVKAVCVRGRDLKEFNLSLYKSISLIPDAQDAERIERAVREDVKTAISEESGMSGGHIYYGFYALPVLKGTHRYLFYKCNLWRGTQAPRLTLSYMEGAATLKELKEKLQ